MSDNSYVAENMFDYILREAGFKNLAYNYEAEKLLQIAEEVRPGRVKNVEEQRNSVGKQTRWRLTSGKTILDWVYGIDTVIAPEGESNSKRFGFDVTLDPTEVKHKIEKLKSFNPLWKAIGIKKTAVVLLVVPKDFGFNLLSNPQKENLVEQLLENIIYPMDEQTTPVRSYILTV